MKTLIGKLGRTLALAGAFVASTAFGGVAKIGGTEYDTLKAAASAAGNGDTIMLTANPDNTDWASIPSVATGTKKVTLDLNGFTVCPKPPNSAVLVGGGVHFVITDTSTGAAGKLTAISPQAYGGGVVVTDYDKDNIIIELLAGTIEAQQDCDHAIRVYGSDNTKVLIKGGKVLGNTSKGNAPVAFSGSNIDVEVTGGEVLTRNAGQSVFKGDPSTAQFPNADNQVKISGDAVVDCSSGYLWQQAESGDDRCTCTVEVDGGKVVLGEKGVSNETSLNNGDPYVTVVTGEIVGGEVPEKYIDPDSKVEVTTEGKKFSPGAPAKIIRGTETIEFETLALALAAVQDGDTVKLGVDADLSNGKFTIAGNVVLDLNGKNIAYTGSIAIENGATLKIVNGKSATSTWTYTGMSYQFNVKDGGTLQLEAGVKYDVQGAMNGMFGYLVANSGRVVMNGGEIVQKNVTDGPFAGMGGGTVVINGGKVTAPKIATGGDAMSEVLIKDGAFASTSDNGAFFVKTVEIVGGEFDLATIAADNADVSISGGTFKKTIPEAFIAPDYGLKEIKDAEGNVIGYGVKSHFDAVMEVKKQGLAFDTRDPNARLVAFSSEDVFQYSLNGWGEQGAGDDAAVTLKLNGADETETGLMQNEDGTLAWKANKRGMYLFTYTSGTVVEDARFYATDLITQVGDAGEVTATYDEAGNVLALKVKLLSDITKQLVINEPVDVTFDMNGQNIMIAESERGNGNVAVVLAKDTTNKVNFIGEGKVQGGDAFEGDSTATGGYAVAYVDADGKYQTDKTGARGTKADTVTFVDGQKGVQLELVSVQQRYPWNGLVDVKYTLSRTLTKATYKLTLTVKAGDETVVAKTFTKAGTLASGDNTMIWNANADMPYTVMKDAEVSLKLEIHD